MAVLQPIIDLVEICAQHGIKNAVLCPGSRSAAITMAFVRNPEIKCFSISDERSAGFLALGIALKTKSPVAIVCTSGSAVYNFAPAVVEAFFQEVPIIVITADRPKEWIHQNDGQTIYQQNIFGENIKKSYNLTTHIQSSDTNWFYQRTVNEAINICKAQPQGPVHLNIPIREPFYPHQNEVFNPSQDIRVINFTETEKKVSLKEIYNLLDEIRTYDKVLIAVGQLPYNQDLNEILDKFQNEFYIPVLGDVISNIRISHISNHDSFLILENEEFVPDLLITLGQSFISKAFKKYFQKHKVFSHWHIQESDKLKDPTQSITRVINMNPVKFLGNLFEDIDSQQFKDGDEERLALYFERFYDSNRKAESKKYEFLKHNSEFSELKAYAICLENLLKKADLHLANSMAVRYANLLGFDYNKEIEVFANRGTSGIDGCLSTAVGSALFTDKLVFSFIGDMAFLYDRNALWNNYVPANLRIIVFNNAGGGIFRLIDGPSDQPELEEFFETKQNLKAKNTIVDSGLEYYSAINEVELMACISEFMSKTGKAKCLEIFTEGKLNQQVFSKFKSIFR